MKAILDFEALGVKVEDLVHEQVHASDENALQETLEKSYQVNLSAAAAELAANHAQKTLDALVATVRSLSEDSCVPTAGADEPLLLPLSNLAAAEGAALRTRILQQIDISEGGLPGLQRIIDEILHELHERERDACQRQERLREIISQAETLLLDEPADEKKSWVRRLFGREKHSPLAPCWNDYARWRLDLVVLHGQRYLWHNLHACLRVLNEQFREMRQELQAIAQEFQHADPQTASEADGNWAFRSILKTTWEELLRKHQRVLVGKLELRLRRMILADFLNVEGTVTPKNLTAKAWAESLRQSVRQELSSLLREIDLGGLVLSSDGPSPNESSPLNMILEHAQSPLHSSYGGAQRLLLACPADAAMETIKQKIEAATQATPCVAQTSKPEIIFCYEVERIPPARIAAQLLENHDDCRSIAAKLRTRVDLSWPRDFQA